MSRLCLLPVFFVFLGCVEERKPEVPAYFDARDINKTGKWVEQLRARVGAKNSNPLAYSEEWARACEETSQAAQGKEVEWELPITDIGTSLAGSYYFQIRDQGSFSSFEVKLEKSSSLLQVPQIGGAYIRNFYVPGDVSARYFKSLSLGSKVRVRGKVDVSGFSFTIKDPKIIER
jgi:hypothetical protein